MENPETIHFVSNILFLVELLVDEINFDSSFSAGILKLLRDQEEGRAGASGQV